MEAIIAILIEKFGFDLKLGLFSIINFFLVYLILKKLVFNKLEKTISERKKNIEEGLKNFELSKDKINQAVAESKIIIDDAKHEASSIIENSYQKAEEVADSLKQKTLKDIDTMMEKARQDILGLEIRMREELKKDTIDLVIEVSEKIIGKKIDAQVDKYIIERSISDISSNFQHNLDGDR